MCFLLLLLVFLHFSCYFLLLFFFSNDTATTEIYTLSLHDALPISVDGICRDGRLVLGHAKTRERMRAGRSEEHTSELQSQFHLVCRRLLEKKKKKKRRRGEGKKKKREGKKEEKKKKK